MPYDITRQFPRTIMNLFEHTYARQSSLVTMNLGGTSGSQGGTGGPPGGFYGLLPQRYVTYDTTEAATSGSVGGSGSTPSLVDNLDRIRFWMKPARWFEPSISSGNLNIGAGIWWTSGSAYLDYAGGSIATPASGKIYLDSSGSICNDADWPESGTYNPICEVAGSVITEDVRKFFNEGGAGGAGTPGGADTQVQYNDGGVFGGDANLTWDSTRLMAQISDAGTTTVVYPMRVSHITSGIAAAGFGAGVEFQLENAGGNNVVAGTVEAAWKTPTNAAEVGQLVFRTLQAATLVPAIIVTGGTTTEVGNARGLGSIEIQTSRNAATEVASGVNSILIGVGGTTSGLRSIGIGYIPVTIGQDAISIGSVTVTGIGSVGIGGSGMVSTSITGDYATTIGGAGHTLGGDFSAIIGGYTNVVSSDYSYALGIYVHNTHNGSFLFADLSGEGGIGTQFHSITGDEVAFRARGGFRHAYDDTYYWTAQVSSAGAVTFATTGTTFQFSDYVGIGLTPRYLFDVAGTGTESKISVQRSSGSAASAASSAGVRVIRSRGETTASPSAILSGDHLGYHEYAAYYDTSNITVGAYLSARATENWDSTHKGTKLVWGVTITGGVTGAEPMALDPVTGLLSLLPITSKPTGTAGIALDANAATGDFALSLSPANLTAAHRIILPNYDLTFPAADAAGYLTSNGAGALSWASTATATAHTIDGATHTVAGRVAGQVLIATAAATFGWSTFVLSGTATGITNFAVTGGKTLTLTATDDYNLTVPKTGTAVTGTGTAGRVAAWVTDANTIQAAALIAPASNVLTLTATAASTLALAITAGKTLTLTSTDDFNLTVPKTGTAVVGTGTAGRCASWSDTNTIAAGTITQPAANGLTITNAAACTLAFAVTIGKTLTLTATDNFNLTIPATGTTALLGTANAFTTSQTITETTDTVGALKITSTSTAASHYGQLELLDDTAIAAGIGGIINFGGKYTGTTTTEFAAIQGYKINATDNNFAGGLRFYTRTNGAAYAARMTIDDVGAVAFLTGDVTLASGKFLTALTDGSTGGLRAGSGSDVLWYRGAANTWRTPDSVLVDTQLGVGVTSFTANGGVIEVSNGITFPAAQSACSNVNTLDDYEESDSCVVTLTASTSGTITLSATQKTLSYTKVGRKVTVTGGIVVESVSSPVGNLILNGLPFTVLGGWVGASAVSVWGWSLAATCTTMIGGYVTGATVIISKFAAGSLTAMAGDVVAGTVLMFSMTYFTTT